MGHLSVVECLVNHGADINSKDCDGKTPLKLANQQRNTNVVEFLRNKGAKEGCRV